MKTYLVIETGVCDSPWCPGYHFTSVTKVFKNKEKAEQYLFGLKEKNPHSHFTIEEIELQD
jgi:hypothetical protein